MHKIRGTHETSCVTKEMSNVSWIKIIPNPDDLRSFQCCYSDISLSSFNVWAMSTFFLNKKWRSARANKRILFCIWVCGFAKIFATSVEKIPNICGLTLHEFRRCWETRSTQNRTSFVNVVSRLQHQVFIKHTWVGLKWILLSFLRPVSYNPWPASSFSLPPLIKLESENGRRLEQFFLDGNLYLLRDSRFISSRKEKRSWCRKKKFLRDSEGETDFVDEKEITGQKETTEAASGE